MFDEDQAMNLTDTVKNAGPEMIQISTIPAISQLTGPLNLESEKVTLPMETGTMGQQYDLNMNQEVTQIF